MVRGNQPHSDRDRQFHAGPDGQVERGHARRASAGASMKRQVWFLIAAGLAAIPAGALAVGALFVPAADFSAPFQALGQALAGDDWGQVRIEQHMIIRITPGDPSPPREATPLPPPLPPERLKQRKIPPCLPIVAITGARPLENNQLLLFLRNRRMIQADLSHNCTARDFYLGFYVTSTVDGLLCAGRDTIHSRAGTTCAISQIHELVAPN